MLLNPCDWFKNSFSIIDIQKQIVPFQMPQEENSSIIPLMIKDSFLKNEEERMQTGVWLEDKLITFWLYDKWIWVKVNKMIN